MTITRVPMTVGGAQQLRDELEHLKSIVRPKIIQDIAEARAHGDLKENAEYHAAREAQSFTEGRIMEIEAKLAAAQTIDVRQIPNNGKVIFGSTVTLQQTENNHIVSYKIVGEDEADIKTNKLSFISPVARAMIGKSITDDITVNTPDSVNNYTIINVEYI
jgi:transcription elongation factor GreA